MQYKKAYKTYLYILYVIKKLNEFSINQNSCLKAVKEATLDQVICYKNN